MGLELPAVLKTSSASDVHQVYRDGQISVVTDTDMTAAQGKSLAGRIEHAYNRDTEVQKWNNTDVLKAPLTVGVLSQAAFEKTTGDSSGSIAGVTFGPNLFVVPDRVVSQKPKAQDEDTIAHELGHVQDFREAGDKLEKIPVFLQEGKEYVLGETYPGSRGMDNDHLAYVGDVLGKISASTAKEVLAGFQKPEDENKSANFAFLGEVTGSLFVEFLRTRLGGKGDANAVSDLAHVTEQVGSGQAFATSFKDQFGVGFQAAQNQFISYLQETEGNPAARLNGTIYAPGAKRDVALAA